MSEHTTGPVRRGSVFCYCSERRVIHVCGLLIWSRTPLFTVEANELVWNSVAAMFGGLTPIQIDPGLPSHAVFVWGDTLFLPIVCRYLIWFGRIQEVLGSVQDLPGPAHCTVKKKGRKFTKK